MVGVDELDQFKSRVQTVGRATEENVRMHHVGFVYQRWLVCENGEKGTEKENTEMEIAVLADNR